MLKVERLGRVKERGAAVRLTVDGRPVAAHTGESVALVLLAAGQGAFRHSPRHGAPRGLFCGMGVCFDCLVTVDGRSGVRACVTRVSEGMRVETGAASS